MQLKSESFLSKTWVKKKKKSCFVSWGVVAYLDFWMDAESI